jgi:hypothetical protein
VAKLGKAPYLGLAQTALLSGYWQRANGRAALGDWPGAAADYELALGLVTNQAKPALVANLRAEYGAGLLHVGQIEAAQNQFAQITTWADEHTAFTVIMAFHSAGLAAEAAGWLTVVGQANSLSAALLVRLGAGLLAQASNAITVDADVEANAQANSYFSQALALAPETAKAEVLLWVASLFYRQSQSKGKRGQADLQNATDLANRALQKDPNYGPAHLQLGLWAAQQGRRALARDSLQKALRWAKQSKLTSVAEGIEEAVNLLAEKHTPSFADVLDIIAPDGADLATRRLLGEFLPEPTEPMA